MNITRARQDERKQKIAQMVDSIKQAKDPDYDKLIMLACSEWGISDRTAKEYLKIALFQIQNETREEGLRELSSTDRAILEATPDDG